MDMAVALTSAPVPGILAMAVAFCLQQEQRLQQRPLAAAHLSSAVPALRHRHQERAAKLL
jgi:hypothetical protein